MSWYAAAIAAGGAIANTAINVNRQNAYQRRSEHLARDFANNSIFYRVEDAKRAGIHPLYALGAQTFNAPTFSFMPTDSLSQGAGQVAQMVYDNESKRLNEDLLKQQIESVKLQNKQRQLEISAAYNKPTSTPAPAAAKSSVKMGDFAPPSSSLVDLKDKGMGSGIQKDVQFMNAFRERSDGSVDFMPDKDAIDYISEFLPAGIDWTNEQFNPFNPQAWEQNQAIADALNVYNPKKDQIWVVDYSVPRGFFFRLHDIRHSQDYRNIPILRRFDNKGYKFIDSLGYYINQNPEVLLLGGLGKAFRYFRKVGRRIKWKFRPEPEVQGMYGMY